MGLIKKSVSDIERKVKFARIVMRVLKECKLVKEFIDYTTTLNFKEFELRYLKQNPDCTNVWYDRERCGNILGFCNFDYYISQKYGRQRQRKYHPYHLVLCYLAIFDEEEYTIYSYREDDKWARPNEYIQKALIGANFDQGLEDADIVRKWLKIKEIYYGNKN